MWTDLLNIGTGGVFGGILGVVGNFITRREERKTLELTFSNQEKMAQINADNQRQEIQLKGDIKEKEIDANSFFMSQKVGNNINYPLLASVRPIITLYLCIVTTYIGYEATRIVGGLDTLSVKEIISIYKDIINTTLMLTTLSVSWWFGARKTHGK